VQSFSRCPVFLHLAQYKPPYFINVVFLSTKAIFLLGNVPNTLMLESEPLAFQYFVIGVFTPMTICECLHKTIDDIFQFIILNNKQWIINIWIIHKRINIGGAWNNKQIITWCRSARFRNLFYTRQVIKQITSSANINFHFVDFLRDKRLWPFLSFSWVSKRFSWDAFISS
jgi:hypothetical protein